MVPHLQSRGAIYEAEEEEIEPVWPLHSDTTIFNSFIKKIELREEIVVLQNGEQASFDASIAYISSRI
jgi:hypothetical protein